MKRKTIIRIINTMIILVGLLVIIGTVIHKNFTLQESKVISPTHTNYYLDTPMTLKGSTKDYDAEEKIFSSDDDSITESSNEIKSTPEESTDIKEYTIPISTEDQNKLCKLAFAEAGNQDVDGKALVMLVVLNRVESDKFPDSISEVIFARNQFSVTTNGMYDNAPTDDPGCLEALELVMQGYDISQGATYFESVKSYDSWHYKNLNFLFEHGDHWFYN